MNAAREPPYLVDAPALVRFGRAVLEAAGCEGDEARLCAEHLVDANLTGHDSHGVLRLPRYVQWLREGRLRVGARASLVVDAPAFALLDGGFGLGQAIGHAALDVGLAKARAGGVGLVALRHAGHLGRIGFWAERACEAGFVSVHFVNVANSALVAPFGSRERRISTAPVAVGVPQPPDHFVLDFATSRVAEGKALQALQGGAPLPPDALVDADGRISADPVVLYGASRASDLPDPRAGPGALRAFGEHKGSGLALACELLAGALTGSGTTGPGERRFANGMLSVYVDPRRLAENGLEEVAAYLAWVRSAEPAEPGGTVLVPGDPERRARAERLRDGVPIPAAVWRSLLATAAAAGVAALAIADARAAERGSAGR